jgi:hypothetical protein
MVELPSDYSPYVFESMHGSDGMGVSLDFTEEDGTTVNVRIPITPELIALLKEKLRTSTEND